MPNIAAKPRGNNIIDITPVRALPDFEELEWR